LEDRVGIKSPNLKRSVDRTVTFQKVKPEKWWSRMRWVSQLMVPGRCEWNEQLLKECMYPHDIDEVFKIRLSKRIQNDNIAWFYE
jgi:hypothetical protein